MRRIGLGLCALALAGCSTSVQTSSGREYLGRYDSAVAGASDAALGVDDAAFRAAASVEPLLRFPARIGIARIEGGQLTPIPDDEMASWAALMEETGGAYGEVTPLNLLVAELASSGAVTGSPAQRAVQKIRLGAARQHMDAVFVYEVFGTHDARQSPLSVGDLTIMGAFLLPGRKVDALGHAEAILLDVRNAYPYLTASETVTKDGLAAAARAVGRGEKLRDAAEAQAVADLAASLPPALAKLAVELGNLPDEPVETAALD
ncbi:hypothetical protein [Parvularcula dongshanensis]|uniref:Lipoprotein n=1 Tax=Parvularcula dongshanensis TaxID=1173995 RepID=A0A840I0G5_9PROT|nr:hypothetical protein [Parvularcula dongshanensis]MBB4658319.1 hypothetical protein [Parvularcula dongshanensis]